MNMHKNYNKLSNEERYFVDCMLDTMMADAAQVSIPLRGDDSAEHAADAMAKWVIASRGRGQSRLDS